MGMEELDGLFQGAEIVISEAGSPYDGLLGVVKKLSTRSIHVSLDDRQFGPTPRMIKRLSKREEQAVREEGVGAGHRARAGELGYGGGSQGVE